jgi:glycosyltransferase involved in cell wall biosynthesis
MARVTVVIPAYNAERTLGATIESVLAQTYQDIEVVVVDDGSEDGTPEVADSHDNRVRCITTPNRGVSEARNTGIDHASGELVAFLDADDLWKPQKLRRQVDLLDARSDAGVSTTGHTRVADPDLRPLETHHAEDPTDACEALLLRSQVLGQISTPLVQRALAARVRFDPRLSQGADWDFFLRLGLCTRFAVIPEPLILYRDIPSSMSGDIALLERDTFAVLDKFFALGAADGYEHLRRRAYSNHWMIVSGSYLRVGRRREAVRCLARGVAMRPLNIVRPLGMPARKLRRLRNRRAAA